MGRNRLQSGVMLLQVSDFCALHVSVVGEEPASITSWTLRRFCCPCPLLLFKGGTWQKGSSYRLIWEIMIKFSQWATLPVSEFPLFSPPLMSQENWDDETFKWKCLSLSRVRLFVTPWTVACQAPLSTGFFQPRILEWVAISSSRGSSQSRDLACISYVSFMAGIFSTRWAIWEASYLTLGPLDSSFISDFNIRQWIIINCILKKL